MQFKKITTVSIVLALTSFGATTASADQGAQNSFSAFYPGNGQTSCFVCHSGLQPGLNAYGSAYKGAGGSKDGRTNAAFVAIEAADSDNDGFSNILELRSATSLIDAAAKPTGSLGKLAGKGAVLANGAAAVQAITLAGVTDLYAATNNTFTLAAGQEILGGVSSALTLATAGSVTLTFEAGVASGLVKVYEVPATGASTELKSASSAAGSVTVTTTSATPTLIVERTVPAQTPTGGASSGGGCMTNSAAAPLLLTFAILSLGFFARRKKS